MSTDDQINIVVRGTPVQQGSKNAVVRGGKAVMYEAAGPKHAVWRRTVKHAAVAQYRGRPALVGPLIVELVFSMPRPKGVKRPYPSVAPDLDKLVRAVGDSLTDAGVYKDDGQVIRWVATELYAGGPDLEVDNILMRCASDTPGVRITITPLDEPVTVPAPKAFVPRQVRPTGRRPSPTAVNALRRR